MKISVIETRTPQLLDVLLRLWEDSVRATHDFLSGGEIEKIKAYVPEALRGVRTLAVAEDEDGCIAAFIGIQGGRIEMLFVAPQRRGGGIGRSLVDFAVNCFGADEVTVNEQNAEAAGFYGYMGFKVYKRTPLDEQGNPYPLLYMRLRT